MQLMNTFDRLFPITRSITGNGVRETLKILGELVPIEQTETPTGTACFDWSVPREWNIRDAYVLDRNGRRVIDFRQSNLHVVNYSVPIRKKVSRAELLEHVYTIPEMPEAIPYRTSYYKESWGFCLQHKRLAELKDDQYDVVIDSTLENGTLTSGEGFIQGASEREVLLSTYVCHPSMANNELSGPLVTTAVYKELLSRKNLRYSYRFLYVPETIGTILFLSRKGEHLKKNLAAGYVVTCVGNKSEFTYKRSRQGNTLADRAAVHALATSGSPHSLIDWNPDGSDERQYCSPGFDLPVGSLMRIPYMKYPEYHTSLDNRSLLSEESLQESVSMYLRIIDTLEANDVFINQQPHCEPQLSKRGLYPTLGGAQSSSEIVQKLMYLLAYSDGQYDLIDIANKLKLPAASFRPQIEQLLQAGLLARQT
jgi:aminopeptidase-like protein